MQVWMSHKRFEAIRKELEQLVDSLHEYKEYLLHQCDKVKSHQQSPQPVDERRHDVMHMPLGISICHLQEVIAGQLKEKYNNAITNNFSFKSWY